MTDSKPPSDQIDVVCAPPPPVLDALADERSPLILNLREQRDPTLDSVQPAYIWLRPVDDGGPTPNGAMIRFAVRAVRLWDWSGRKSGRMVLLTDDLVYAERVVAALREAMGEKKHYDE